MSNSQTAEQANIKTQFSARACFPNAIRAVDCTHIALKASSQDEFAYVNRKQLILSIYKSHICDAQMQLNNIVAKWPGSIHDSFVLTNRLQAGTVQVGWLLGE